MFFVPSAVKGFLLGCFTCMASLAVHMLKQLESHYEAESEAAPVRPDDQAPASDAKETPDAVQPVTHDETAKSDDSDGSYPWPPKRKWQDWKAVNAIPKYAFKRCLLEHIDPDKNLDIKTDVEIIKQASGSYHACTILYVPETKKRYVIKVPAHGTRALWEEGDATNIRSEVGTMKYIAHHTYVPVPEVFGFDDGFDNHLGAPYILMAACEGKPATELWYANYRANEDHSQDNDANSPTADLEERRLRFLKSLAKTMAELRKLPFDKIGQLNFDNDPLYPEVSDYYARTYLTRPTSGVLVKVPAYSSSQEWWAHLIGLYMPVEAYDLDEVTGMRKLLQMNDASDEDEADEIAVADSYYHDEDDVHEIHLDDEDNADSRDNNDLAVTDPISDIHDEDDEPPSDIGAYGESFLLKHNDLDLQNIFVDDEGNVTGIIDWDECITVPRSIGPTSLPLFLTRDYFWDYTLASCYYDLMPPKLQEYRYFYSKFMQEATSGTDGVYTAKSGLYNAVLNGIESFRFEGRKFADRVVAECAVLRAFTTQDVLQYLGSREEPSYISYLLDICLPALFDPLVTNRNL